MYIEFLESRPLAREVLGTEPVKDFWTVRKWIIPIRFLFR